VDAAAGTVLGLLLLRSALRAQDPRELAVPMAAGIAACAASALAVALRRLAPLSMLALVFAAAELSYLGGFQRDPFIAVGLVLYLVAAARPKRVSLGALLGSILVMLLVFGGAPAKPIADRARPDRLLFITQSVAPAAVLSAAWSVGFAVRRQRAYVAAVRAQADDQVRAQHDLAWRTVTEERLRIARELHDVVAHSLSVITVQAGVGRHVLDAQPQQAASALGVIETTGREALQELRQLLGVLREDGSDAARAPAPRIADLEDMIRRVRQAGTAVHLDIRGTQRPLPGGIELSAYRIVQEALTNVVKHARTDRCHIRLAYAPETLSIEVTDDGLGTAATHPAAAKAKPQGRGRAQGPGQGLGASQGPGEGHGPGQGHGIIGMRERAVLHGGSFEAGPLPTRGYRVAASLPLRPAGSP
jgi:signal transduction histidine kinase